jgi:hypothetical protein
VRVADALDRGDLKEPPPGYIRPGEEPSYQDERRGRGGGDDDSEGDDGSTSGDSASEGAGAAGRRAGRAARWAAAATTMGAAIAASIQTQARPSCPHLFCRNPPTEEPDGIAVAAALKSKTDFVLDEDEANVTSGRGAFDVMLTTYSLFERESQRHT